MRTSQLLVTSILVFGIVNAAADSDKKWRTSTFTDPATNEFIYHAFSPSTWPVTPIGYPQQNLQTLMFYNCINKKGIIHEFTGLWFSNPPNLNNKSIRDDYYIGQWRAKWGDNPVQWVILEQHLNDNILEFRVQDTATAIRKIQKYSTFLIELSWKGHGGIMFRYMLNGSTKAIQNTRQKCETK